MFWGLFFFISGNSEIYFSCTDLKNYCCSAINHCGSYKPLSYWEHLPNWGNIASVFPGGSHQRIQSDSFLLNSCSLPALPFLLSVITWWKEISVYSQALDLALSERTKILRELSSSTTPVLWAVWNHSHRGETSPGVDFIAPLIAVA